MAMITRRNCHSNATQKLGGALNFMPLTLNYSKIHASFVTAEYEQWRGGMLCWRNLISASVAQFSAVRLGEGVCLWVTWKMLIFRQDFWILMTPKVHGRYKIRAANLGNDDNGRFGTFRCNNLPAKRFNVYHHSNIPPPTNANFRLDSKLLNFPALQMKKACLTLRKHS